MGSSFSQPVNFQHENAVTVTFRSYDKIRILYKDENVIEKIEALLRELSGSKEKEELVRETKHGCVQFRMPGTPFSANAFKESVLFGKVLAFRIVEALLSLGFELQCSTDLSRLHDNGTLFFLKPNEAEVRPQQQTDLLCLAPFGERKVAVLRGRLDIVDAINEIINQTWKAGLAKVDVLSMFNEQVRVFKLRGQPWKLDGIDSVNSRLLLADLVGRLGNMKWKWIGSINTNGQSDCLLFRYVRDKFEFISDLSLLSIHQPNRIRCLNFDLNSRSVIRESVLKTLQKKEPEEREYQGIPEFKLKSNPFATMSLEEAINTRRFICRMLENLSACGLQVHATFCPVRKNGHDFSNNKITMILRRCEQVPRKFACLALADTNRMALIGFTTELRKKLVDLVGSKYEPGVIGNRERSGKTTEIVLNGNPWSHCSCTGLHGRSLLVDIISFLMNSERGWQFSFSGDISAKFMSKENESDYPYDVHSWFFSKTGKTEKLPKSKSNPLLQGRTKIVLSKAKEYEDRQRKVEDQDEDEESDKNENNRVASSARRLVDAGHVNFSLEVDDLE